MNRATEIEKLLSSNMQGSALGIVNRATEIEKLL